MTNSVAMTSRDTSNLTTRDRLLIVGDVVIEHPAGSRGLLSEEALTA